MCKQHNFLVYLFEARRSCLRMISRDTEDTRLSVARFELANDYRYDDVVYSRLGSQNNEVARQLHYS